jgi:hypothetical protein
MQQAPIMPIPTRLSQYSPVKQVNRHELGPNYKPRECDVICAVRGKGKSYMHPGNVRLRVATNRIINRYVQTTDKKEKTEVLNSIIDSMRKSGARFISFEGGIWYEVGDIKARDRGE